MIQNMNRFTQNQFPSLVRLHFIVYSRSLALNHWNQAQNLIHRSILLAVTTSQSTLLAQKGRQTVSVTYHPRLNNHRSIAYLKTPKSQRSFRHCEYLNCHRRPDTLTYRNHQISSMYHFRHRCQFYQWSRHINPFQFTHHLKSVYLNTLQCHPLIHATRLNRHRTMPIRKRSLSTKQLSLTKWHQLLVRRATAKKYSFRKTLMFKPQRNHARRQLSIA